MHTLKELAQLVGGRVAGDENIVISDVATLEEAEAGTISFIANPRYRPLVFQTKASAIVTGENIEGISPAQLIVREPYLAFSKLVARFHPPSHPDWGIDGRAYVGKNTLIGRDSHIAPFCYVESNVQIGSRVHLYPHVYIGTGSVVYDDTVLYPNVTLYHHTTVGKRCIIHSGCVIGADGFGFAKDGPKNVKIQQIGRVEIGDDVEIGANTTIDRAALGVTRIGSGTKIDNLVQIAHNVHIGENSLIASQTGISGSTQVGNSVVIAGQVGIIGHLKIGDQVMIGAQSGIAKDVPDRSVVSGSPAFNHSDWLKAVSVFRELPGMRRTLNELKKRADVEQPEGDKK
ncbi:MAG: UDP-3-O-(3-hydroxymyristoyl)glucosamine N-acyltransferase [Deltaproteobacteria bacterium]|nr:UDP-3-O-(3-hydroxymyristoyl)glucosamine N-acyltransferase [Deltaproteobacteria bacterium]MCL5278191.1 UDP-3-O-(3-hydroxymyristoyl)glucosamine N-acyltransferase [Deltaproteobacteria bacterium]